ncbi:SusC/RagA family TonB-linked outer membrane protein [Hymenobacter sp. YC55]|uniref:SusC/RagA family TonB-linked outer membrane protein n=1 Tax=Hymenobacter sp. YC55 TaxID=3034019 RepID=UPI0023F6E43A|nr:SusC/RagA family TonB-linked outer membrane protein [Hymenobacter sp. YC55]MDF7813489.1 SusC/RagA family TonB-linked outer membrane protein [Hymenobacter sp. YC55]
MNKTLLMSPVLMVSLLQQVSAQDRSISGKVTDRQTGEGLPGVTVLLKGTTNGISTNSDGSYNLNNVPASGGTLVFSSVGYVSVERPIGSENTLSIALATDSKQLSEVVVTALGIEKDTRSLGYATQEIKSEQISQKSEPNVLNALQGKVSGVTITNSSGLPGASTNINIRGITSLQGSNQPLFVVDGIPISNNLDRTNGGSLGTLGGAQTANRAVDIDPETIESINILKGPAAAALYGSRAAAGAVIITTKSGRSANKKLEVTVTSGLALQQVYGIPDFQNDYGQGLNGINQTQLPGANGLPLLGDINTGSTASWGPRFGSTPTIENGLLLNDRTLLPYQAYKDNIKDFYRTGRLLTNGVNLRGGTAEQNFVLGVNHTDQKGIAEFNELERLNINLGGNTTLINKLKAGASMNFASSDQLGSAIGNGSSAFGTLVNVPRSYNLQGLPYKNPITGRSVFFSGTDNPLWNREFVQTTSKLTRFFGSANVSYDITPWLNVLYRGGLDTYTDRRKGIFTPGAARVPSGQVLDEVYYRSEFTGDFIATLKKDNILTEGLNASLLLGQQVNSRRFQRISSQADNLLVSGFPNSSVASVYSNGTGEETSLRRLLGYYTSLDLSYNNYLFLTLTGRVDESSTLPKKNNTFFYPSASAAFVFTDALGIESDLLSYGKIKGAAAQVGRDTDPYNLNTTYAVTLLGNNVASLNFPLNGLGGFTLSNTQGNPNLKPEFTRSFEGGLNLGLFANRLSIDATYFYQTSRDQIIPLTTPASTGFLQRTANAGRLDNKGIEGLVTLAAVKGGDFTWDVTLNYTRIRNKVVSLIEGVERSSINGNAFTGTIPSFVVGQPYGVIVGGKKPTSPDGQYIINPLTGLFAPDVAGQIIANPNFDWQAGLNNTFSYKGIGLSFLIDTNQGGDVVSFTNNFYKNNGALKETGVDRELPRVIPGVIETSNPDGTKSYRPNNIQVSAQDYWRSFGLQSDLGVYDATVYRLREVTLGYTIPKPVLERLPFGGVTISLSGRNLFYYAPNANFDPELNTQGAGNIRGLDIQGPPNARTYGVNLRFTL